MEQLKNESETELQNQSEIEMQNQSEAEMRDEKYMKEALKRRQIWESGYFRRRLWHQSASSCYLCPGNLWG